MKTTKRAKGIYGFEHKGIKLEVENMAVGSDGETKGWFVFVLSEDGDREYVMDYDTKTFAIKRTIQRIDEGTF